MPAGTSFRFSDEDRSRLADAGLDAETIVQVARVIREREDSKRRAGGLSEGEREKVFREIWRVAPILHDALAKLGPRDRDCFASINEGLAWLKYVGPRAFHELPEYLDAVREELHCSVGRADPPPRPRTKLGRPFEIDRFVFALAIADLLHRRGYPLRRSRKGVKRRSTGILMSTLKVALPAAGFDEIQDMGDLVHAVAEEIEFRYSDALVEWPSDQKPRGIK